MDNKMELTGYMLKVLFGEIEDKAVLETLNNAKNIDIESGTFEI